MFRWDSADGKTRAWSHCRFVLPPIHFTPDSLAYSVPLFLKRQCDRTLGKTTAYYTLEGMGCCFCPTGSDLYVCPAPLPRVLLYSMMRLDLSGPGAYILTKNLEWFKAVGAR